MGVEKRHSISIFISKVLWIVFLIFRESNLVICGDLDDSLQNALEAVERRQRNLQLEDNDFYGQPENIGYGFQKNFGFFENGPARELGSFDSDPENDNELQNILLNYLNYQKDNNDYDAGYDKRKSNFRERSSIPYLVNEREFGGETYDENGIEYLQLLRNLWSKYRSTYPETYDIEGLTDDQVEEILRSLYDKDDDEYSELNDLRTYGAMPLRNRRNYRVFDRLTERRKRRPGFGEGLYGKRNGHSQHVSYEPPPENDFLYALKLVNPEINREAVETLKEKGFEVLGDEKDKDVMRMLNSRPKYLEEEEEPYLVKEPKTYENDIWYQEPISLNDEYPDFEKDEKRNLRFFKPHNGVHVNRKRFPVKRSSIRVRKEAADDKVSKEIKGIFRAQTTAEPPKKKPSEKKPTDVKKNVTKPEIAKVKKVVRRADQYTKEEIYPPARNEEISDLFHVKKKSADKKSIDWSQYFGINKRSPQVWFGNENRKLAESHFLSPKNKRYSHDRINAGNVNFLDKYQYEIPFDTRIFNSKKRYSYDIGTNIDKMENKIGNIEEKIIDDAVKYTGAHSGTGNEDASKVKNEVIRHLGMAYTLEKMKSALEEFKNSMKTDKNFIADDGKKAVTEAPKNEAFTTASHKEIAKTEKPEIPAGKLEDKNKRVAVKKEGVEDFYGGQDRSGDNLEFLNWPIDNGYSNNQYDNEECPVLDKILHNCMRVEEIYGRYAELLLPICSLQQICYLCGSEIGFSRPSSCDLMYLTEAQNLCQGDKECLRSSRDSMLALRDLHEQDMINENVRSLYTGSCLSNSCIQRYFLNTPGAVVPLEYLK